MIPGWICRKTKFGIQFGDREKIHYKNKAYNSKKTIVL